MSSLSQPFDLASPHYFLSDDQSLSDQQQAELNPDCEADYNLSDANTEDGEKEQHAYEAYTDSHPEKEQLKIGATEIGDTESTWSVSSFRKGMGVDKLRDDRPYTYWQSNVSPLKKDRAVNISFHRAIVVSQVSIFIDYLQDQTYTPKTIAIRGGNTYRDLQDLATVECPECVGWVNVDFSADSNNFPVFALQIRVLNTYSDGKDTQIRQIKLYTLS
ncbi:anaphase-promoting complex, subunit 10-domain-containing protein [Sporodiniella umbellata]|nr:anaphase-promoting complex, subunit 10-domain-containing protein [Sporodiniella umbellata]